MADRPTIGVGGKRTYSAPGAYDTKARERVLILINADTKRRAIKLAKTAGYDVFMLTEVD